MRIRMSIIGKLTLAAISLIFLAGSANAGCVGDETGTDFGCGDTVTESCTFDENMSCSSGHGLVIGENGATINGNGYMLDGTSAGACDGLGIQRTGIYNKAHDDVMINDLEVKNFCNGIYFKYDSEEGDRVERVIIENCNIHHNGGDTGGDNSVHGIKVMGMFNSTIKNCKIHHNAGKGDSCEGGGNGIFLKGISGFGAWNNTIIHNEIYDNRKGGFFTKMMCENTEVSYNNVWGNGQGGIILRCKKTTTHDIHHNNASCNYGDGLFVGGPDNIIRDNIVNNNKAGFKISPTDIVGDGDGIDMGRNDGSYNNELYNNTVCGNEGTDIDTYGAGSGTTGANNTCDTCSDYHDEGETCCTYNCPGEYPAGCVAADGTVFRCGDTVTKSCTLNGSMSCEGEGLIIGSGQIHIYGDGYCIEGTGTGIYSAGNTFLGIHDLAIKNFEKGIWLQHVREKIYDYEIDNCNINNNTVGIDVDDLDTRSCTVGNCEVHRNSRGIHVHGENGTNIKITDNKIYDNAVSGIHSEDVCMGCKVDYNVVWENGIGITVNASQWTLEHNLIKNSSESGIFLGGNNNILSYNTVGKNGGDGIHIAEGSEGILLKVNTVCGNEEKDISVDSSCNVSGDENACETTENYDDAGTEGCTYHCVGCIGDTGIVYRCGGIITESCTFNDNITCPEGDGLIVWASGMEDKPLIIDGAEHALDGVTPGDSMRTGIYNPDAHDYITIKNIEVKHFHHGINLGGSPGHSGTVEHNVIDNCSVHDNGDPDAFTTHGIATYHARNCTITNCEIYNNTGYGCGSCEDGGRGLLLYGPGDHNTVTHNKIYDNAMAGIYSKMKSKYNYVAYNDVYGNGKQLPEEGTFMPGGIILACIKTDYWVVEYNNITGNYGSGISVGGSSDTFKYNNIINTTSATGGYGNGIYIGRCSSNHTLFSNTVCDNEGEDIYVQGCCSDVTGDENTCDTCENYNDGGTTCCTYSCSTPSAGFDTGAPANPYPSIFGTHNGTIIQDQDITVNKMYTYPCEGTGGHTGYAMIWNETTGDCAKAYWDGYTADYHNISFNRTLTLREGVIYNYAIRTGSYPQIIHAREYEAKEGGNITCTVFIDANGKVYEDWIPAIRLFLQ